jgi:serine/threonine protein kinase
MKDEAAYKKEKAAARILQRYPDAREIAVYAVRACKVELETLDGSLLAECNAKKAEKREPVIDFTGHGYIVEMPYVEHTTLSTLTPGDLTKAQAMEYLRQLQAAITTLQNWGIYHCDLHDDNVWIANGRIVIADFGVAKFSNDDDTKREDIKSAIPSFVRLWYAVDSRERGAIKPADIERHMDQTGTFYTWPSTSDSLRPRFTAASPADTPPSSGRRQRSSAARSPAERPTKRGALNFDDM